MFSLTRSRAARTATTPAASTSQLQLRQPTRSYAASAKPKRAKPPTPSPSSAPKSPSPTPAVPVQNAQKKPGVVLSEKVPLVELPGAVEQRKRTKIETIPFLCTPADAQRYLENAAHSALGLRSIGRLLWTRFCERFFGVEMGELPAEMVAFKPFLIPTWKIDLNLVGKGLLGESQMDLAVSALNMTVPGFSSSPLDELSMNVQLDAQQLVTYDPKLHLNQHDLSISALPFTLSPTNFLQTLRTLPRTSVDKDGIGLNPAEFKPRLFATYPLYLPIYLAEFLERSPSPSTRRRITCVAFASSSPPVFSIYPSFLPLPRWMPQSDSLELSVSGSPSDPLDIPAPEALQKLAPKLERFVSGRKGVTLLEEMGEGAWEAQGQEGERVMRYSEWAEKNQEYGHSLLELETAQAAWKSVSSVTDDQKAMMISVTGLKVSKGVDLKAVVGQRLREAKIEVEKRRPGWVRRLEMEEERRGEGR